MAPMAPMAPGYGGPAFMPQGMAVGFFLATAIRASFAGVEKKLAQRSTLGVQPTYRNVTSNGDQRRVIFVFLYVY